MRFARCWPVFLCSVVGAQRSFDASVTHALERARPTLMQHLEKAHAGGLALLCLAAIHDGVPATNARFRDAIRRLARAKLTRTYDLALRLMVAAELPGFPDREKAAKRDATRLFACQRGGSFGYVAQGGPSDLSNTQYGALGLRAAAILGVKVSKRRWRSLAQYALARQARNGSFGYRGKVRVGYASMTAAGIAVLEIAREQAELGNLDGRVKRGLARGWQWFDKNAAEVGRPQARHCYYFHYGLERAAVLSRKQRIGSKDWYRAGAEMLIEEQLGDGGWVRRRGKRKNVRADPVATAFAVLFLRRKFSRLQQPTAAVTPRGTPVRYLPSQATVKQIADSVAFEVARGMRAVPDLLRSMRSPSLARRKGAALAMLKLTGKSFGYSPYRDPSESGDSIQAAEGWWMRIGRRKLK